MKRYAASVVTEELFIERRSAILVILDSKGKKNKNL